MCAFGRGHERDYEIDTRCREGVYVLENDVSTCVTAVLTSRAGNGLLVGKGWTLHGRLTTGTGEREQSVSTHTHTCKKSHSKNAHLLASYLESWKIMIDPIEGCHYQKINNQKKSYP